MDKQSITRDLRRYANGHEYINKESIKRCLGCGNDTVERYVRGLAFRKVSRTMMFDVKDVAEKVMADVQY